MLSILLQVPFTFGNPSGFLKISWRHLLAAFRMYDRMYETLCQLGEFTPGTRGSSMLRRRITQPTSWSFVTSPPEGTRYQVVGSVTGRSLQHTRRSVEECSLQWSSWWSYAMALAGYSTLVAFRQKLKTVLFRECFPVDWLPDMSCVPAEQLRTDIVTVLSLTL